MTRTWSKYQKNIFKAVERKRCNLAINAVAGSGKCLGIDTPILMYDGTIKPVQDIRKGDVLMGPDSAPRLVQSTNRGIGPLYRIKPHKGNDWVCNDVHVLSLAGTNRYKGQIIDIPLDQYLDRCQSEKYFAKQWKLFRAGVTFAKPQSLPIEPYLVGLWIGDGSSNDVSFTTQDDEILAYLTQIAPMYGAEAKVRVENERGLKNVRLSICTRATGGKHQLHYLRRLLRKEFRNNKGEKWIPQTYLVASRQDRLQLLAGLIDTDGYYGTGSYEFTTKYLHLAEQVAFLCRSLGFSAYVKPKMIVFGPQSKMLTYFRLSISGAGAEIPCLLKRKQGNKRQQIKRVNVTGFSVEPVGVGEYYGFTLNGDGRFLLGDFTVTHNTTTLVEIYNRLPRGSRVAFMAFTKHIVGELKSRLPGCEVMTLHSLGFRAVRRVKPNAQVNEHKIADLIDEYMSSHRQRWLPDGQYGVFAGMVREVVNKSRLTLTDLDNAEQTAALLEHFGLGVDVDSLADELDLAPAKVEQHLLKIARRVLRNSNAMYEQRGIVDFDDMVYLPVRYGLTVERFDVVLVDEAQDLNAAQLELLIKAAGLYGRIIAVGDPCQPPETLVTVQVTLGNRWHKGVTKQVPIADVQRGDQVLAYGISDCHFYAKPVTGKSEKYYEGNLVRVTTSTGNTSRYTMNHHCVASFEAFRKHYCVYLMRKGAQYRVGMSRVDLGTNQRSGPVQRMIAEDADALWILEFHKSRDAAYIREQAISGRFGLPQLMFTPKHGTTVGLCEQAWEFIGDNISNGINCLCHFGRDFRYPLFAKDQTSLMPKNHTNARSLKRPMVVRACNLVSGCLMLPYEGQKSASKTDWQSVTVNNEYYEGFVYSLDVDKYHTYIADNIVTHNCQAIMGFAGADNESFKKIVERINAEEMPLSICYRCPKSHIALAQAIVPQIEAAPDADDGVVEEISMAQFINMPRRGDLIICRTNAPLVGIALRLIANGIQARIRGRNIAEGLVKLIRDATKHGIGGATFAGAVAEALERFVDHRLALLQAKKHTEAKQEMIRDQQDCILAFMQARPTIDSVPTLCDELMALFADADAAVWCSSIHRSKGLEAERVFQVRSDALRLAYGSMLAWQAEQEANLEYVAHTRAKRALYRIPTEKQPAE